MGCEKLAPEEKKWPAVLNAGNFLWRVEKGHIYVTSVSLHFGPAIGQKVKFTEGIWISTCTCITTHAKFSSKACDTQKEIWTRNSDTP